MAFNYQINITAVNRAEEVISRIEKLFSSIHSAVDRLTAANETAAKAARGTTTALTQIGDQAEEAGRKTVNMSNAIAIGMLKAQGAIKLVSSAVDFMKGKFMEAAEIQLQNISASSTFASLTGKSYEEAAKFTDEFNIRISKAAATLPGSTAGYAQLARVVGDSVLPAFKDVNGEVDMKGYEEGLFKIVESFGAVAAGGGIDIGNTALGLTKAFAGASTSELRQIQIFEQNPVILNAMEDALKAKGAKSFKDVDEATRLEILTNAAKQMITDDFIKRSSESVSGLMEGFKSAIFDPSTGLFGVFRDLNEEAAGSQTAFQSFNELLVRILGGDGIFGQLTKFLQAMNLPDPMRVVKQGLDFAVSVLDQVIRVMKDINILIDSGYNIGQIIRYMFTGYFANFSSFPDMIAGVFDKLLDGIEGFVAGFDGETFGQQLADGLDEVLAWLGNLFMGMTTGAATSEKGFLARVGSIISDVVFQLIVALGSFFGSLDTGTWVALASIALAAFLIPALIASVGAMLLPLIGVTLVGSVPALLILAAVTAFAALGKVIWDNKDQIGAQLQPFFEYVKGLWQTASKIIDVAFALFTGDWEGAFEGGKAVTASIQKNLLDIMNMFKAMYDAFVLVANPILQTLGQPVLQTAASVEVARVEEASQIKLAEATYGSVGGSRWMGQMPNIIPAADGLMSALATESAKMPSNAQMVVANTSEAILTPTMLRNLVSGSVAMGSNTTPAAAPNITFQINGAQDPQAIANEVLALLDTHLGEYMQGQLA